MQEIEGADKLIERFGFFPVFHDGEILSVVLDRDGLSATLTILMPEFRAGTRLGNVEVVLQFFDVEDLRLEGFNYQNVISSLTFETADNQSENTNDVLSKLQVNLDTFFGMWATFRCSRVYVQGVATSIRITGDPPYLRQSKH